MNKKDFMEIMNEIHRYVAVEKNIEELEISMNDNHDLVKFFVYGVNFAKKEPLVVYINNEKVSIYTDEELYDTLSRIMDKNAEVSVGKNKQNNIERKLEWLLGIMVSL